MNGTMKSNGMNRKRVNDWEDDDMPRKKLKRESTLSNEVKRFELLPRTRSLTKKMGFMNEMELNSFDELLDDDFIEPPTKKLKKLNKIVPRKAIKLLDDRQDDEINSLKYQISELEILKIRYEIYLLKNLKLDF